MSHSRLLRSIVHRRFLFSLACLIVVAFTAAGCSGQAATGDPGLAVEISLNTIAVENHTGVALSKGEISLIPTGIPQPYLTQLSYLGDGERRAFPLSAFRNQNGAPFNAAYNPRVVRITATDTKGATHEREVPYKQ
jgi:hypothetical protein